MRALPTWPVLVVALSLLAAGPGGCHDATSTLVLEFPSEAAFVASGTAQVSLYDAEHDLQVCRKLIAGEPTDDPLATAQPIDICDYQQAGVSLLQGLDQGVRALHVEVYGKGEAPILRGCTTFGLSTDGSPITVQLSVTEDFQANRRPTSCSTADQRCAGGC